MPAPLFKRWAPTSKPAPKPAPPALPATQQASRQASHAHSLAEVESPHSALAVEEAHVEVIKSVKKPKKRKRDAGAKEQDEETSKKHKNIFNKFEKASRLAEARKEEGSVEDEDAPLEELHDLQPMPQPAPVAEPTFEPTFSTLPPWLAQPIVVEASKTLPFSELGVDPFFTRKLEKQGFNNALAVQTALLPMLHPGFEQHLGDTCVSAKTGSGKTLAYLLPIVEALKDRAIPVLSAIVIVPSRQLVNQALQVAEDLCAGTKIKVGTALGNVAFPTEQKQLVKVRAQYNPKKAQELQVLQHSDEESTEFRSLFEDLRRMPPDHVPQYDSGVDILICTPGRLVEHIENTTGFLLNAVKWLIIDEADQLLNQNYQGWTSVLMNVLESETPGPFMNAQEMVWKRERDANSALFAALPARRQLTKIVLSATMEKDLTKLGTLKLRRPKLVVVQDEMIETQPLQHEENLFELPSTLEEFAVHVGDGSNKPLHLLYLLAHYVFPDLHASAKPDTAESSSDSSSDSSAASDNDSESDPEREQSLFGQTSRVLIFTKSTESASRLSHLISVLEPAMKGSLQTMTRALTADAARKLLRSFSTGATKILVASDAASRGLDIPSITHVINYDMPSSITSYVHRVGRTARAGRAGQACTLFTKSEAAWFLKQVATGSSVRRGNRKVKRLEWKESTVTADGKKKAYRVALKQLESAVTGVDAGP
ncbi:ATP-dependent RNA helicase dbp6 [Coniothyrium glycines]